jgi:methyl-accepting chemotaxis protein
MCVPILDIEKQIEGYIMYSVDLQKLSEEYVTKVKIGETGYVFTIDTQGTTVMHPDKDQIFKKDFTNTSISKEVLSKKVGIGEYDYKGIKKLVAYSEDKEWGFIYLASIPTSELTVTTKTVINVIL